MSTPNLRRLSGFVSLFGSHFLSQSNCEPVDDHTETSQISLDVVNTGLVFSPYTLDVTRETFRDLVAAQNKGLNPPPQPVRGQRNS